MRCTPTYEMHATVCLVQVEGVSVVGLQVVVGEAVILQIVVGEVVVQYYNLL